jgi:hypothetical protein
VFPDRRNKRADVWKVFHTHLWLKFGANGASASTVISNCGISGLRVLQLNGGIYSRKDWRTLMFTQEPMCLQRMSYSTSSHFPSLSGCPGLHQRPKSGELRQYHCIPSLTCTRRSTRTVTLSYSLRPNPPGCPVYRSHPVTKPHPGQRLLFSMQLNRRLPSIRMRCFTAWDWRTALSSSWGANLASDQMEPMV